MKIYIVDAMNLNDLYGRIERLIVTRKLKQARKFCEESKYFSGKLLKWYNKFKYTNSVGTGFYIERVKL